MGLLENIEEKLNPIDGFLSIKPNLRLAAVLIPVFIEKKELLFTKRTENLRQHQGQISFPGGKFEEKDNTLTETILRETEEEVGIHRKNIDLKGRLPPLISTSKNYVYPFVGFILGNPKIKINPEEVQEYFLTKIDHLLDPETLENGLIKGEVRKYYRVEHYKIWGLTQQILSDFLAIIKNP